MDFKTRVLSITKGAGISDEQFNAIGIHDWPEVFKKIEAAFIKKENSNTSFNWWWEDLKGDQVALQFQRDDAYMYLHHLVDKNEKIWFVASDNNFDPTKFWLFEGYIEPVQQVIGELYAFEYYLVSKKYDWLLAENHHGYLIGMGAAKKALMQLQAGYNL
ncbi:MAG: hypothetical protein QM731_03290 [Chitinophagaceae bacterium]